MEIKSCPCCKNPLKKLKKNEFICNYCNNGFKISQYTVKEWNEYIKSNKS